VGAVDVSDGLAEVDDAVGLGEVVDAVGDADVVLDEGLGDVVDADGDGLTAWNRIVTGEPEISSAFTEALTRMSAASSLLIVTVHRPSDSVVHVCWESTPGASAMKSTSTSFMTTPAESFTIAVRTTSVPVLAIADAAANDDCCGSGFGGASPNVISRSMATPK